MGGDYRQRGVWRACFLARAVRPAARYFPMQYWKPIRIDVLLTFSSRDHGRGGGGGGRGGRGGGGLGLGGRAALNAGLRIEIIQRRGIYHQQLIPLAASDRIDVLHASL